MSNITDSITVDHQIYWSNFVAVLNENISIYGIALIWFMGNFGSTANCFIFCQRNLRKNPCVMYFLASSASQFLTFNFAFFTRMLHFGYNIQAINTFLWYCKIRYYFVYVFVAIPRYYIILALIDRYFASSSDIFWRRWSSPKIAMRLIIGNFLFWCFMYIQVLVFYEIQHDDCSFRNDVYGILFSIYLFIENGILPPSMMLIFGYLTLKNIRQSRRKTRPMEVVNVAPSAQLTKISRKDLQISKMLFNQIFLWIILNLLNPCYLLYRTITINDTKSPLRVNVESLINNISYIFIYFEFSLTFFVYTLSSPLFRHELNQLIRKKLLRCFRPNMALRNSI